MKRLLFLFAIAIVQQLAVYGQKVDPKAYYADSTGVVTETTSISDGQAPLEVTFRANPEGMDDVTPAYEWHFRRMDADGQLSDDFMVRRTEETDYTFMESGTFHIILNTYITHDDGTQTELPTYTLTVAISESKLEMPNAFSPNDDKINDVYRAKEGYKSIVEFRAIIVNRWGQKLYEWRDPAGGWDGTYNGKPVKDGVYYVMVTARGADGRKYNIRKDVNLLRGYSNTNSSNSGGQ